MGSRLKVKRRASLTLRMYLFMRSGLDSRGSQCLPRRVPSPPPSDPEEDIERERAKEGKQAGEVEAKVLWEEGWM